MANAGAPSAPPASRATFNSETRETKLGITNPLDALFRAIATGVKGERASAHHLDRHHYSHISVRLIVAVPMALSDAMSLSMRSW
jgi:hypothetical protein